MAPRLEEVFQYLDKYGPEDAFEAADKALYLTALGLAEISLDVELFRGPLPFLPHSYRIHIDWINYDADGTSSFRGCGDV
jgi:hypothetical protein